MHIFDFRFCVLKPGLPADLNTLLLECDRLCHKQLSLHVIKCDTLYFILIGIIKETELLIELRTGYIQRLYNVIIGSIRNLSHTLQILFHGIHNGFHHILCIPDIILAHSCFIPVIKQ